MAKIKSTLDLVMERTKNLSMTQEDREALQKKELTDKAKGWVRMLADRKITVYEFKNESASDLSRNSELKEIIRKELLGSIDPDFDNSLLVQALGEVVGFDVTLLDQPIKEYRAHYEHDLHEYQDLIRFELKAREISGAAVVPNTKHDESFQANAKRLKDQCRQKIQAL